MAVVTTDKIRNVVFLGHTGTGKSTLVEAILRTTGDASGPLDGCPNVDSEAEEKERGHSLSLTVASVEFDGHRLNLLDAPGAAEAIGDAYPALVAADLALFVVDGAVGWQPQHEELWEACESLALPRAVFINKLDLSRAAYQQRIRELTDVLGPRLTLVELPLEDHGTLEGVIDIVHEVAIDEHDHHHDPVAVPDEFREEVDHDHELLVESVVEHDDELLAKYLEGEEPSAAELEEQLAADIAAGELVPVLCGAAAHDVGVEPLLRFLVQEAPSPRNSASGTDGATAAFVAKTFTDPYVGRISVLRVLSGDVRPDDEFTVQRSGETVRAHQLTSLLGRAQTTLAGAAEGDVIAVAKLGDVRTGDVLVTAGGEAKLDVPEPPMGHHRVAISPRAVSEDAKLVTALDRAMQEDPGIRLEIDDRTGQRIVSFLGPTHVDVTVARLENAHGVDVIVSDAPVAYQETIRRPATAEGRHVKQSGGHGQYGIVTIEIYPTGRGEGFEFEDRTVGGVVPKQYVGAVEKGLIEAMRRGAVVGHPMVDIGARLLDGKHHSVDSSDAAFKAAAALAFRNAVTEADPVLLEPIMAVTVRVPDDLTGSVLSDLAGRRGRILGTTPATDGRTFVQAHVPDAELATYSAELRALTSGLGKVDIEPDHYDEVPASVAKRLASAD